MLDLHYMECGKCKELYHILCLGMKNDTFEQLTPEYKIQWICPPCISVKPKTGNIHTPVRSPAAFLNSTYTSNSDDEDRSYNLENVTIRGGARKGKTGMQKVASKLEAPGDLYLVFDDMITKAKTELEQTVRKVITEQLTSMKDEIQKIVRSEVTVLYDKLSKVEQGLSSICNNQKSDERPKNGIEDGRTLKISPKAKPGSNAILSHGPPEICSLSSIIDLDAGSGKSEKYSSVTKKMAPNYIEYPQKDKSIALTVPQTRVEAPKTVVSNDYRDSQVATESTDEWKEVKRKRSRLSVPSILRGKAAPGVTLLEASEKWKYFHLFYVKQGTTEDQIREHLKSVCEVDSCTIESLKSRGNYASFKLGVPDQLYEKVTAVENWTENICIKPWRQNFRSKSGFSKTSQKDATN